MTPLTRVTPDNFDRAETDRRFAQNVEQNGFGRFAHQRAFPDLADQTRYSNRDTLRSAGVFDLDAGPVTISLPETSGRFLSLQILDEDGYSHGVAYAPGEVVFARESVGTRYAMAAARVLAVESEPDDMAAAHAAQDAIAARQPASGRWEAPTWDPESQGRVREALISLAETVPDTRRMYGDREAVGELRHLVGAAASWGGNPEDAAVYQVVRPVRNDGRVPHRLVVHDVPVDGFWSVSVYNAQGYFEPNPRAVYSVNSLGAKASPDGSIAIHMGDSSIFNFMPISDGWTYWVRLYRPRPEALSGAWRFPEAEPSQ